MKITVVCGMLGSGKTTFISQYSKTIEVRAAVLVNDFGKSGIDGEIFSAGGIETIELPSGCVCCTLKSDLISSIKKILKTFRPEHLIIEPSGIASPSGVIEALSSLNIQEIMVVGIVDATEFLELNHEDAFGRFFHDQIGNSDIVLVNKTDLVDRETISRTVLSVEKINSGAIILTTVNCLIDAALPAVSRGERSISGHSAHLHYDTVSLRLGGNIDHDWLIDFFQELSMGRYGDILRAKALVNTVQGPYKFDMSFTNISSVPFEKNISNNRLVLIGSNIQRGLLMNMLQTDISF